MLPLRLLTILLLIGGTTWIRSVSGSSASIDEFFSSRIVGGTEAKPHSLPWQVSLLDHKGQFCGGSVISHEWILTAAHCIADWLQRPASPNGTFFQVRVGAHNLLDPAEPTAETVNVLSIRVHPYWGGYSTFDNDFCLVKLSRPLKFNYAVSAIQLTDSSDGQPGQQCIISGWGKHNQRNDTSRPGAVFLKPRNDDTKFEPDQALLRQAFVSIIDQLQCRRIYAGSKPKNITDAMICARPLVPMEQGACKGDSGGPLACQSAPGEPVKLVGVISWGFGCADIIYPGVLARVSSAMYWIRSITNG